VVASFAYNVGVWIDKFLFWWMPGGPHISIAGPIQAAPIYDNGIFWAFLSIIPAVTIFFIKIETDFYYK
jgi:uncharacterized membrane protein